MLKDAYRRFKDALGHSEDYWTETGARLDNIGSSFEEFEDAGNSLDDIADNIEDFKYSMIEMYPEEGLEMGAEDAYSLKAELEEHGFK